MCSSRIYPYSSHRRDWNFLGGGGFWRTKDLKKYTKLNWNFQRGEVVLKKVLPSGRYGYFLKAQERGEIRRAQDIIKTAGMKWPNLSLTLLKQEHLIVAGVSCKPHPSLCSHKKEFNSHTIDTHHHHSRERNNSSSNKKLDFTLC